MANMSKEAARARYLYNRKYIDAYWERRGAREASKAPASKSRKIVASDTPTQYDLRLNQADFKGNDQKYIESLEKSNRALNRENKRLARLLLNYQTIIAQAASAIDTSAADFKIS